MLSQRDSLILDNIALVRYIAYKEYTNIDEDVISEGTIGLIKAADKYDPVHEVKFSTFAAEYIRGYISTYFRKVRYMDSLDEYINEDTTVLDTLASEDNIEQEVIEYDLNDKRKHLVNTLLKGLPENDIKVFKCLLKGNSAEVIQREYKLPMKKVTQIINKVERYLKFASIKVPDYR